ncbi:MAG: hypothetical protein WCX48_07735 [Bacteroidales bacterium]
MLRIKNGCYRNILFYIMLIMVVFPMFLFRDYTLNDELKYLSIADEALRNGDIFTFTNHGIDYADKPPLYIWIIMLGKLLFGTHSMLFLGIFSLIPALVVLHVMDKWVNKLVPRSDSLNGQLMLITSGYFIGSAVVIRMDMLMCMFIVLSLYTFFRIYSSEEKPRDKYMFGVYIFMAIFSKGPVGILVPLLSTVAFLIIKGDIKTIGRYWGWRTFSILLVCCGLWFLMVYLEGGTEYLNNLVFNQTINRAINSFHHKEPIYYYLKVIWYSLAPWSFLYIGILIAGLKQRLIKTDLEKFFVTIVLTTFILLSLVSSKIEIYMLPAFPFFAYITVLWLSRFKSQKWMTPLVGLPAFIFALALPGVIVACFVPGISVDFPVLKNVFVIVTALVLSASGIYSITNLFRCKLNRAISVTAYGILVAIFLSSFAFPKMNPKIGMGELCYKAKNQADQRSIQNYYFFNINRFENTDVYLGAEPKVVNEEELNSAIPKIQWPAILFIRQKDIERNAALSKFILEKEKCRVGDFFFVIL